MDDDTKTAGIRPGMTVLDIISSHSATEAVFRSYDSRAGVCICCESLFEPLETMAARYGLDLRRLMEDLEAVVLGKTGLAPPNPGRQSKLR